MKKTIIKIVMVILTIMLLLQTICYADLVDPSSTRRVPTEPGTPILQENNGDLTTYLIIGGVVLVVVVVAIIILNSAQKKENASKTNNK